MNPLAAVQRVVHLLADPKAPRLPRLAVGVAVLYLILPVDLVPEWFLPLVGYLDDFALLWFSVRWLLRAAQQPSVQVLPPSPGSLGPAPPPPVPRDPVEPPPQPGP